MYTLEDVSPWHQVWPSLPLNYRFILNSTRKLSNRNWFTASKILNWFPETVKRTEVDSTDHWWNWWLIWQTKWGKWWTKHHKAKCQTLLVLCLVLCLYYKNIVYLKQYCRYYEMFHHFRKTDLSISLDSPLIIYICLWFINDSQFIFTEIVGNYGKLSEIAL